MDEPITICGPRQKASNTARLSSSQRPMVPALNCAAGFAVAGIVEARHGPAVLARPAVERRGLGALHVGLEAAQPEQAGRDAPRAADGDEAGRIISSNAQEFQAKIAHSESGPVGARHPQGVARFPLKSPHAAMKARAERGIAGSGRGNGVGEQR